MNYTEYFNPAQRNNATGARRNLQLSKASPS